MKKNPFYLLVSLTMLSNAVWAFGTELNLGTAVAKPGESLVISVDTIGLYDKVYYDIDCSIDPLREKSAVILRMSNRTFDIQKSSSCSGDDYSSQCNVDEKKFFKFSFLKGMKGNNTKLSLTNIDFTQDMTVSCTAHPSR